MSEFNFVYRHLDQKVLIGGTTQSDGIFAKDWSSLIEYHQIIKDLIPNIPEFCNWCENTGTRQKGSKGRPYWGPCSNNPDIHYEISNLYKNGFTLPFLAAKDLLTQMGF